MKNSSLAQKIKELRMSSGSSQEELAEKTQLSLRTVQRIENGETQPRGDSLKRLALALGVATEELTDLMDFGEAELEGVEEFREQRGLQGMEGLREDKGFLAVLHLSALSFLLFPGFLLLPAMGILVPLTLWLLKKDQIKGVREAGKKILNFQISWFLVFAILYGNVFICKIFHVGFIMERLTMFRILIGLYLFNVITIIVNVVRLGKDKTTVYRPAIPFMAQ
ncbi:MAG TPA: helix-turn-helix domain-containing protein [Puia sp.]